MPGTEPSISRDTLKLHLDIFKHLTSLAALISVALLALGERFEGTLATALVGVVMLGLTLVVCLVGIFVVSRSARVPSPSNLAFFVSEVLVGLSLVFFFTSLLAVLDGALRETGLGLFGWLRLALS